MRSSFWSLNLGLFGIGSIREKLAKLCIKCHYIVIKGRHIDPRIPSYQIYLDISAQFCMYSRKKISTMHCERDASATRANHGKPAYPLQPDRS